MTDRPDPRPGDEDRNLGRLSKFLALVLRHRAHQFDLDVDDEAFVGLEDLLELIHEQDGMDWVTAADIEELGGTHIRCRFEIRDERVRATYGHSFRRPIHYPAIDPPEELYAGLSKSQAGAARATGLQPAGRQFVHLTDDKAEAEEIGRRQGPEYEVITVMAKKAAEAGIRFHKPTEGIYLSLSVPAEHLDVPVSFGRRARRGARRR
jgi:putative RNA 2'-phosphotransferase